MAETTLSCEGDRPEQTPWLWSRTVDLGVFGGAAAFALAVAALSPMLAPSGDVPTWAWFVFVLGLDVAHVWSTTFRTYFDREELAKRKALYALTPVLCLAGGIALHVHHPLTFWRVLAYAAVFHFVRQQVGWVAIYRARAREFSAYDRWLDNALIYAATGWPVLYWHAHLPRAFEWFVPGDFIASPWVGRLVWPAAGLYVGLCGAYLLRSLWHARRGSVNLGKHVVVVSTAVIWLVGIVLVNEDFTFTVTNVTIHAVPYFALLWAYSKQRASERPGRWVARVVSWGWFAFVTITLVMAFTEELLWERLVWHERPGGWFGGDAPETPVLGDAARHIVVPLLSLPQVVHYVLDGVIWRSKDAGPAQARALGFAPNPSA